jgi:hypothetical protein
MYMDLSNNEQIVNQEEISVEVSLNTIYEETTDIMETVYKSLKEQLLQKVESELNMEKDMIELIRIVMELIETTDIKGVTKKETALKLLRDIVNAVDIQQEIKESLLIFINGGIAENTIDMIIRASKNELNLNTVVEYLVDPETIDEKVGCCFTVFGMLFRKFSRQRRNNTTPQQV